MTIVLLHLFLTGIFKDVYKNPDRAKTLSG